MVATQGIKRTCTTIKDSTAAGVSMELMPLNYYFSMTYAVGNQQVSQNLASNPTVIFQTGKSALGLTKLLKNLSKSVSSGKCGPLVPLRVNR